MGNFHLLILSSLKGQKKYFKPDNQQKKGKKKEGNYTFLLQRVKELTFRQCLNSAVMFKITRQILSIDSYCMGQTSEPYIS